MGSVFVLGRRGKGGGGWGNVRRGGDDGNGKGGVKASKWGIGGVEGENCQWREGKWGGGRRAERREEREEYGHTVWFTDS